LSEELKIIMDTIAQLGQAGKEAFIWWLLVKYVAYYFVVLAFFVAASACIFRIVQAVRTHQDECRIVAEVAVKCGVRQCCYYDRQELNKMFDWVRRQSAP